MEGIKPSTHGPKPRMLSLHHTELKNNPQAIPVRQSMGAVLNCSGGLEPHKLRS